MICKACGSNDVEVRSAIVGGVAPAQWGPAHSEARCATCGAWVRWIGRAEIERMLMDGARVLPAPVVRQGRLL